MAADAPSYGPWPKGMDNRQPEHSLAADLLRNAVNVDIDNSGRVRSRAGLARVYNGTAIHSLFSCPLGTFFVEASTLKRLNSDYSATALRSGVVGKIAYEYVNGEVYFSDTVRTGKIDASFAVVPWGCPNPVTPTIAGVSGSLAPGRYTVFTVGVLTTGEESGASEPVQVNLPQGGGLQVNVGTLPGASSIRIFVTSANGDVGYLQISVSSGAVATISTFSSAGREMTPEFTIPPPVGNIIKHYRGRLYVVSGNVVWYTEPYAFGRVKPQTNFYQFPANVSIFMPVTNGIYCVADQHYFMAGNDPGQFLAQTQLPYGAVAGTGVQVPNDNDVMWMSVRGAVRGDQDGNLGNLQEKRVAVDPGDTGAAIIREQNGLRQFISAIHPTGAPKLADTAWMTAETIRRG